LDFLTMFYSPFWLASFCFISDEPHRFGGLCCGSERRCRLAFVLDVKYLLQGLQMGRSWCKRGISKETLLVLSN
jgi:hypothetical protein